MALDPLCMRISSIPYFALAVECWCCWLCDLAFLSLLNSGLELPNLKQTQLPASPMLPIGNNTFPVSTLTGQNMNRGLE